MTIDQIVKAVCEVAQIDVATLKARKRMEHIVFPRQMAMNLAYDLTSLSLDAIGQYFDRGHATVIHAIKATQNRITTDSKAAMQWNLIRQHLGIK
jgi:chromosomal replication initiator protein